VATYAEKISAEERRLDPARPAAELARNVRGLTPHVGTYLETSGGERLGVRRARAVDVGVKTGEVKAEWGALLLGCGRGALRLEVVQPPGGKPMAADAYLRGHSLPKL
jgi:methionyl-tRNA formyltransferase